MTPDSPRLRFAIVGVVTISLIAALFARLWFLQVMTSPQYQQAASVNGIRVVRTEAPRGRILDRNGKVLVDNRSENQVTVDWQQFNKLSLPQQNGLLARLSKVLTNDLESQAAQTTGAVATGGTTTTTTGPTTTTTTTPGSLPPTPPQPVTVAVLKTRLNDQQFSHFTPVPVADNVSENLVIYLTEHSDDFPTVSTQTVTVREYPYGDLLAQLLGQVGPVNEADLAKFQNKAKPYALTDEVGKSGIERLMEPELRGTPGITRYEVNAQNQPIAVLPGSTPPIPGDDVYLSIDVNLQYIAERSLAAQVGVANCSADGCAQAKTGAVVVTDPRNGQVLAMASYPTFDPNDFVGGISQADYSALLNNPGNPLENKAIAGEYSPGSTWKLFTADAGLSNNQIQPDTEVDDTGSYHIQGCNVGKCTFTDAFGEHPGVVNLSRAITVSSDYYFYKLGDEMWDRKATIGDDALARTYNQWGFGVKTGLGLPGESLGRVPSPEERIQLATELYKGNESDIQAHSGWYSGDNLNTAIGQGDVLVTPLQLVNGYATFANGGTLYTPQLVLQVLKGFSPKVVSVDKPEPIRQIAMQPDWRAALLSGFEGVTQSADGTAGATFAGFPESTFAVAGKTGTAQVANKQDTSLFVAFAPENDPQFAAVAVLPEGGNGGGAAAPLIRRIFEPLAAAGGNLKLLPQAPLGGYFDVKAAEQEVIAPSAGID